MRGNVEATPIDIGNLPVRITVSIGIAAVDANASVESSIGHSDAAMYAAKQNGRNQVKLWDAAMPGK